VQSRRAEAEALGSGRPAAAASDSREDGPMQSTEDQRDASTTPAGGDGDAPRERFVGRRDVTAWKSRSGQALARRHQGLADRLGAHRTLLLTLAVGGGIAALATVGAERIYDAVSDRDGIASLDKPALALAKRLRSPATETLAASIAHVFGPIGMPLLTVAAATTLAVRRKHVTPVSLLSAAGAGSLLMTISGKNIVRRHRPHRDDAIPPYETSPSFPSGHTLNATTIAGTLAYLLVLRQEKQLPQALTIGAAGGTAVAVGLSRVLLGAHWFTDVAVGWTTGTGWLALVVTSHRLYLTSVAPGGPGGHAAVKR
jgi:membrane-associated phospholipid phosphatase